MLTSILTFFICLLAPAVLDNIKSSRYFLVFYFFFENFSEFPPFSPYLPNTVEP